MYIYPYFLLSISLVLFRQSTVNLVKCQYFAGESDDSAGCATTSCTPRKRSRCGKRSGHTASTGDFIGIMQPGMSTLSYSYLLFRAGEKIKSLFEYSQRPKVEKGLIHSAPRPLCDTLKKDGTPDPESSATFEYTQLEDYKHEFAGKRRRRRSSGIPINGYYPADRAHELISNYFSSGIL